MTLQGVIRGFAREVEASRTKHLGVNQQTLVDMGIYCTQNAEAIAARLDRADDLERRLKSLLADSYQAATALAGIGLTGFNDTPWTRRRLRELGRSLHKTAAKHALEIQGVEGGERQ